jgi:hypothetical protein
VNDPDPTPEELARRFARHHPKTAIRLWWQWELDRPRADDSAVPLGPPSWLFRAETNAERRERLGRFVLKKFLAHGIIPKDQSVN